MNHQSNSEYQVKKLEDYIVVLKNIVPDDFCDEIVQEYKDSNQFLRAMTVGGEDLNMRNCFNLQMSAQEVITVNYEKRKLIDDRLYIVAGQAVNQYQKLFYHATNYAGDSGYTFLKYDVGGKYDYHVDDCNANPRKLSLSFTLNDGFEGGEFAFFYGHKIYKLNKGDGIIFPSSFMFPHSVLPITSGTRYSIVTWFV